MSGNVEKISTFKEKLSQKSSSFVLKQMFKNVSKAEIDKTYWRSIEDHYGVPWFISINRSNDGLDLGVHLHCIRSENEKEWSIDTDFEIHVLHPTGNQMENKTSSLSYCFTKNVGYGQGGIMRWETMEKEFLLNDELVVEIRVKITKMTGIELCLRNFDDEECSDVALVVNQKKFHVSKLYLASQSSYFKSMFLGKFNESGKTEIILTDINGYDLQKYLEMLYGEDALDDETVEGILHLADMYDTKTLIGRCEEYLLEVSRKTLKEKLEISVKYKLAELKKECMSKIKTIADVRSVIPDRVRNLDHDTLADLLEKTLALAQ